MSEPTPDAEREVWDSEYEGDPEAPADDPSREAELPPDERTIPTTREVTESDPAGGPEGTAGGMGVSSEWEAKFQRAPGTGTYGAGEPHPGAHRDASDLADDVSPEDPPEQSAAPATGPEENPDLPPAASPTSGTGNPLGPGPGHEPDESWRTQEQDPE